MVDTSFINRPITSFEEATLFLDNLIAADMHFHLEDDPSDIIRGNTGQPLFSDDEARDMVRRVNELYSFDWSKVGEECPIGYILTKTDTWAKD